MGFHRVEHQQILKSCYVLLKLYLFNGFNIMMKCSDPINQFFIFKIPRPNKEDLLIYPQSVVTFLARKQDTNIAMRLPNERGNVDLLRRHNVVIHSSQGGC